MDQYTAAAHDTEYVNHAAAWAATQADYARDGETCIDPDELLSDEDLAEAARLFWAEQRIAARYAHDLAEAPQTVWDDEPPY